MRTTPHNKTLSPAAAKAGEQRFQNLVRDATVGIIVLEGDDMMVGVVNAAYARLIGRTTEQLTGYPLFSIIPEAEAGFRPILDSVRVGGESLNLYEHPYAVTADGKRVEGFLNLVYQPYRQADGMITGVMVLCQDVTAQVEARRKAEVAEAAAGLAAEAAGLGTFDVDLQTDRLVNSKRLDEIFDVDMGSDRNAMIRAIHPEDLQIRKDAYKTGFKTGTLEYELRIIKRDGNIRWIRTRGKILYDVKGQAARLLGAVHDITEERQFSEELSRQVQERTRELEQFLFVSHHDLQEPLRKMMIFSQQAMDDISSHLSPNTSIALQKVNAAAQRMSAALKGVMNMASLRSAERPAAVDLNEIIAGVLNDLELAITESGAKITADDLPMLPAVATQMQQLFYNLLANGLKFARPGITPTITITSQLLTPADAGRIEGLNPELSYYYLVVTDNGIGFDQQHAERIFKMFQRLHSKKLYAGTGIGLALCKKVVDNHFGRIWALSQPGDGAAFHIVLPAR